MIAYLFLGKERPRGVLLQEAIVFVATLLIGILSWFAWDRSPPWVRLRGEVLEPVHVGGSLKVRWHTTPLARACPGTLQIELISGALIWPVLSRPVSSRLTLGETEYDPRPWPVSRDIPPGPTTYRVTSFWYCNWLQEALDWPIIQVGPDIPFTILPE